MGCGFTQGNRPVFPFDFRRDFDGGAYRYEVVEIDDIEITHTHAPVAGRCAELAFCVCPVDVNVAKFCVRVVCIESMQPEDAGLHVVGFVVFAAQISCRHTAFENHSRESVVAVFLCDPEPARRRLIGALLESEAELGSRTRITAEQGTAVINQVEGLTRDMDENEHGGDVARVR